jgi:hypothetical protein
MTVDSSLVFPSSRVLAGWWQQLAPLSPLRIWIAHLRLHRIEAPVGVAQFEPLDRFTMLLLGAVGLLPRNSLTDLERKLCLGQAIVLRLLRGLGERGLALANDSGEWALTPAGRRALADGCHDGLTLTRRVLHFVDNADCNAAPHFLKLGDSDCLACEVPALWQFPRSVLEAALRQSPAWKSQHGFPMDIHEVPGASPDSASNTAAMADWRHIVIDRPGALLAACVLTGAAGNQEALCGYAIRPESWTLRHNTPVLRLGPEWRSVLPGLARAVGPEVWNEAWTAWCHARGVSLPEPTARLERLDVRLRVPADKALIERLRPFRGEAWLLSTEGAIREAARVELVEAR